jgi:hypothetical protein
VTGPYDSTFQLFHLLHHIIYFSYEDYQHSQASGLGIDNMQFTDLQDVMQILISDVLSGPVFVVFD